jgi:DNA-binding SARP family transcriptional activator
MSPGSTLAIRLLGRLDVLADDVPVRIGGRHAQALMALLVLRPRARLRDTLAAELWPEAGVPSAASLRQALWLIRSSLTAAGIDSEAWLESDQDTIGLHRDAVVELDVDRFERLAASEAPEDHERALRMYAGDLLEGLGHECFAADRERLSDLYEDALTSVAEARLEAGDIAGARWAATQVLSRDPLREEAHCVLIAAYGAVGSRSQVIRQYRRVTHVLRTELAVAPLPETEAAYRSAIAMTITRSAQRAGEGAPRRVFTRASLARVLASAG